MHDGVTCVRIEEAPCVMEEHGRNTTVLSILINFFSGKERGRN